MKKLLLLVPAVLVVGCFPRTAPPPGTMTEAQLDSVKGRWPDLTLEYLEHGRHIFIDNCDHCHGYPDLTYKQAGEWPSVAERMGKKCDLDAKDIENLQKFIAAAYPKVEKK